MYATRTVTFDSSSTVLTVEGGDPIYLHSIVLSANNTGNATQSFNWNTGASNLSPAPRLTALANDSAIWHGVDTQVQSLALTAAPSAGAVVTITYRVDG